MGWGFSLRILSDFSGTGSSLESWRSIHEEVRASSFSKSQIFRCVLWRTRRVAVCVEDRVWTSASKLIKHVRDFVDRFWGVTAFGIRAVLSL
ncbi:hypothetical protein PIB30_062543 [Stylosanthes scabra]|uniref:Uncharacterized protein n=1 Tax=Stylosanthes scabra TaxID=79078 RepID=A0ABU6UNB4_9FABA|nr:hypothetical protein [Stylosanthes scabra]